MNILWKTLMVYKTFNFIMQNIYVLYLTCFVLFCFCFFSFSSLEDYKQWHLWLKDTKKKVFTVVYVHTNTHTHPDKHSQGCILYINTNNKDLSRCKANTEWGIMTGLRQIIYERGCNWTLQILQLWVMDEQERAFASVLHMLLSRVHSSQTLQIHICLFTQYNKIHTNVTLVVKTWNLTHQLPLYSSESFNHSW